MGCVPTDEGSSLPSRSLHIIETEQRRRRSIVGFQFPLGLTAILMASTFAFVNMGLARTPDPERALAAFAVAQTAIGLFTSPTWATTNLLVALGTNPPSMRNVLRVMGVVTAIVSAWLLALAFSPLGHFIFVTLFGASESLLPDILTVIRIGLPFPLIYTVRSWAHARIIQRRRTGYFTVAMASRLAIMLPLAIWVPRLGFVGSTGVGALIWLLGVSVEAAISVGAALWDRTPLPSAELSSVYSVGDCVRFLSPLIVHGYLSTFTLPVINAGLARSASPETNLAAFQVSWSFLFLFISFIHPNTSQTILVFLEDRSWWKTLRRVAFWFMGGDTGILLLLIVTGGAQWLMKHIMGIDLALMQVIRPVLLVGALLPVAAGLSDLWAGIALRQRRTIFIVWGKVADVVTIVLVMFLLAPLMPALGAAIAPAALVLGYVVNYLVLRYIIRRQGDARWLSLEGIRQLS